MARDAKKDRTFPTLDLTDQSTLSAGPQPTLEIQSPKTPTLSRKLKAVSLDSDPPKQSTSLEVSRDVFSMPNTPKRQIKHKLSCDFDETGNRSTLTPNFSSNLKKFASNNSIFGSQTLKTLPEIMTLQDFSDNRTTPEPVVRIKTKGLLERRGSNASLTIDLGSNSSIADKTPCVRLNTARSVSNLNLSTFETLDKCCCGSEKKAGERRKSQEACNNCIIYESVPSKANGCKNECGGGLPKRCGCTTTVKCRRKSLSNENLYVPPCGFCEKGAFKDCTGVNKHCKAYRMASYPKQKAPTLSDAFKMHLQNVQYLQTAGNLLSIADLRAACEVSRVPKLHSEFWEVPLNLQEKCYVSGSQSHNRYKGVLPNEHSRVHLPTSQSYIHANYIKGPDYTETAYIATQGPMSHTCQDFWEMVWHTNCVCVVMLTGLVEKGRSKCELYFPLGKKDLSASKSFFYVKTTRERDKFTFDNPQSGHQSDEETVEFEELDQIQFGCYTIRYVSEEYLDECVIRRLEMTKTTEASTESRLIHHYWYPNWQDHKMANPQQLLKMALRLLETKDNKTGEQTVRRTSLEKSTKAKRVAKFDLTKGKERRMSSDGVGKNAPIVVHCSAGIGRTGCFLAILNGIQQLRSNYNVDVLAILCSLRLNRGGMVQTAPQYELIHRVLNLYADTMP